MSLEKDQAFFRNFSIVVIILAVMMVVFLVTAYMVGDTITYGDSDARVAKVSERTAPVGDVRMEGEAASAEESAGDEQQTTASAEPASGKTVYENTCTACHGGAIAAAPALGDSEAWAPRIEKGIETLYTHAIDGFQGEDSSMAMPPKGGDSSLSDEEVEAAVDYMVENSQ